MLDTTYVVDLMGNDDGAVAKRDELLERGVPTAISTLSIVEVGSGLDARSHREQFDAFVDGTTVVPLEQSAARRAASIQRDLQSAGDRIGNVDAMVAATAVDRDEPVLTRNVSEFRRVDALQVVPY